MGGKLRLLIFLIFPITAVSQNNQLVLNNITVIEITTGNLLSNVSVAITGNRITDIGKTVNILPNATIIDARGKYLIPGLWDMHVHLSYYGVEALPMLVANGITGVRDMGGNLDEIDKWRAEIGSGTLLGPRIKRAGPFIDGPKKMNFLRKSFTKIPANEEAARSLVDSLKTAGVDFLKVHSRLPRSIFFALADQAKLEHIPFVVHVPKDILPEEAVSAGPRSIEHTESLLGNLIYEEQSAVVSKRIKKALKQLYGKHGRKLAENIAANEIFYDPTLISLYKVRGQYEKQLAPRLLPIVSNLYRAGVSLMTGSDFGSVEAGIRPGYDLHGELALFIQAGMTPLKALQSATINPAKCLFLEDSLGTVEKGKIADLVLLNENPLESIKNTMNIYAVILNGKYLSREDLNKILHDVEKKKALN